MGGSKVRDVPSNIIVFCSKMNNAIESDAELAEMARGFGWKLRPGDDPKKVPVFLPMTGLWVLLGDDYDVRNLRGETDANNSEQTRV